MHRRMAFLSIVTTLVLLVAAFMPMTAFAQEGVPPPPDEPVTEEAPPAEEPVVDEVTLPELLDALPEGTDVVPLDANGDALPLTSDAAAEVLLNGDPMWCPGSTLPGGAGCTPAYASFAALNVDLSSAPPSGDGTIYVSYDYDVTGAAIADAGGITIDWLDNDLDSLVIQGGWNFGSNTVVGTSTIGTWMDILNWGYPGDTLTINDLVFTNGGGLYIYDTDTTTDADVTLNNVSVTGASGDGAYIETTGSIAVNDSNFSGNASTGLEAYADGDLTLNSVTANGNGGYGVYGGSDDGNVSVDGGDFSLNNLTGMYTWAGGGTMTANSSNFSGNGSGPFAGGLYVSWADDGLTLNNVTANGNTVDGVEGWTGGDFFVTGGDFSLNGDDGIDVNSYYGSNMTLMGVSASGNGDSGASLDAFSGGNIYVYDSAFNDNGGSGLRAFSWSGGSTSVTCSEFQGNTGYGVSDPGTKTLTGNIFAGNGSGAYSGPAVLVAAPCFGEGPSDYASKLKLLQQNPPSGGPGAGGPCPDTTLTEGDISAGLHELCGHEVGLDAADQAGLPGALPSGATLSAGVTVVGADLPVAGGSIKLSFPVPSGADASTLAVLFWDGTQWVEVPGGAVVGGMFEVTVTQAGTYVLVTQ